GLSFDTRTPIKSAAKRVVRRSGGQVTRTYAGHGETTHEIGPHLEMVEHTQLLATPWLYVAGLHFANADDVVENLVVRTGFDCRTDEVHVAADAGKILPQLGIETAGREFVVVECVVRDSVAHQ